MGRNALKKPNYDGSACLLYDFMISQGLTEKNVMQRMGLNEEHPYFPVSLWIQDSGSIPSYYMQALCSALNAPIEALFIRTKILNGLPFSLYGHIVKKTNLEEIPSDELIEELKHRGYKIYKEV